MFVCVDDDRFRVSTSIYKKTETPGIANSDFCNFFINIILMTSRLRHAHL